MAYTVLARKYRSQTFDDVMGQEPISRTLKNAIETGRVAHAYLFTGTRGVGKTTMARILAKALNCLEAKEPTTTPCLKCSSCVAINTGEDIDVIEIDGASNNRVDEIRELRENAIYRPARARYKIYIIDEVHMLTTAAFNALLKTLEEPPEHVKFIFATTEPNKVLATIQSRCQRFDFGNISPKVIAEQLKTILQKEGIGFEEDLILPVARMANGSMRDALSLLDRLISTGIQPLTAQLLEDFLGRPNAEKMHRLIERIAEHDAAGTLTAIEDLVCTGLGEIQIVDAAIESMRDLLVLRSAGANTDLVILTADQKAKAGVLAGKFDAAALIYNITALEKLRWTIKNSDTPRALLDASLLRFALSEHFMNVDELMAQAQGAPGAVKKKLLTEDRPAPKPVAPAAHLDERPARVEELPLLGQSKAASASVDLAQDWTEILEMIRTRLGNGTAGLLTGSTPRELTDNTLVIEFPPTGGMQKHMCESNGRADQIASFLSEHLGQTVRVKFALAAAPSAQREGNPAKPNAQKRYEIVGDPAVKIVLVGLDATITKIEENQ
ncbi:MAG TPA: DNA polymerase III subunit gamma/tau [Sedimentisphaerales bacterium]|jgi:DNA polymerase-3 subunit gamma/tau|nr:DNA polymerase III subunit gamma/tau [Sedimentisphaerales bacterium]HNU30790.1 DNA polymerase III subunit gamma/tau [Sedimentisphaerales bacterium]